MFITGNRDKILNLGCGKKYRQGMTNVDICSPADLVIDLNQMPWPWRDGEIEMVVAEHSLEHLKDVYKALDECCRILKSGGVFHVVVPHSTCAGAVGCLRHYRTFSYNALRDFLADRFDTMQQRLVWLPHYEWVPIQWLIDLNPILFERGWGYWVGGATEVKWVGIKK